ncbi:MAG: hypothetical protein AAFZ18_37915 [Myxococcota bacterium]
MSPDVDGDGIPSEDDCDDLDAALGSRMRDADCDGVLDGLDECPLDPSLHRASPPRIQLDFPASVASTNATALSVRGTVTLSCGAAIDEDTARAQRTGMLIPLELTQANQGVVRWAFTAPLAEDSENAWSIEVEDSNQRRAQLDFTVLQYRSGTAPTSMGSPWDFVVDRRGETAYVLDRELPGIYAVNLDTGESRVLSGGGVGQGAHFTNRLSSIGLDEPKRRLVVTSSSRRRFLSVDLRSGDRKVISNGTAPGPAINNPLGMAVGSNQQRGFYVDIDDQGGKVVQIDFESGKRSVVSDAAFGEGPLLEDPRYLALDTPRNRLLVLDASLDALIDVDIVTGRRKVISSETIGVGPLLRSPRGLFKEPSKEFAVVADGRRILRVNLETGERELVSSRVVGATVDEGAELVEPRAVWVGEGREVILAVDSRRSMLMSIASNTGDRSWIQPPPSQWPPRVGTGPRVFSLAGAVLDSDHSRLFVADRGAQAIVEVNLATGARTYLTDPLSTESLLTPRGLGLDASMSRLLVTDSALSALLDVDLETGAVGIFSSSDLQPTSEQVESPNGPVVLEPSGTSAVLVDTLRQSVLRVDLRTGERTVLARASEPDQGAVRAIALDNDRGQALVTLGSSDRPQVFDGIMSVDLVSGETRLRPTRDVVTISDGQGVEMTNPRGIEVDGDRALVFDADRDAIIAVDLDTWDRTEISGPGWGRGDVLTVENNNTNALTVDRERRVAFAVSGRDSRVNMVDLETGDQVTISF